MRLLRMLGAAAIAVLMVALLAGSASAKGKDRNRDRIPDRWERAHHLSLKVKQTNKDQDKDGLKNLNEYRSHTNPHSADSNGNGVGDVDEDADHDGVDNGNEQREHTNPGLKDTNHNGVRDGREDADHDALNNKGEDVTANDPINPDTDGDGIEDGQERAGTVDSFDAATGVLVINALDGTKVTGKVTDATEIKCESEDNHELEQEDNHSSSSSDESGPGGSDDSSSDEHSGQNHDGEHSGNCTVADLVPGTPVHSAELSLTSAGAVWHEVELIKDTTGTPPPVS